VETQLTCREVVEIITEYLEGAMPSPERRRFELHLLNCPHCVRYLEQMRETIRLTGTLSEESLTGDAKAAIMGAFRSWNAG
jgi:anti-sigma factor RsiW